MASQAPKFDLEERTAKFGGDVIRFSKQVPKSPVTIPLITNIVRASTTIGANYCEMDHAFSKQDFLQRISICRAGARETKHWLQMILNAIPELHRSAQILIQEAGELSVLFTAIINKVKEEK